VKVVLLQQTESPLGEKDLCYDLVWCLEQQAKSEKWGNTTGCFTRERETRICSSKKGKAPRTFKHTNQPYGNGLGREKCSRNGNEREYRGSPHTILRPPWESFSDAWPIR
jgi:hypothetical protein